MHQTQYLNPEQSNQTLYKSVTFGSVKTYHPLDGVYLEKRTIRRVLPSLPESKNAKENKNGDGSNELFQIFSESFSSHLLDCSCENTEICIDNTGINIPDIINDDNLLNNPNNNLLANDIINSIESTNTSTSTTISRTPSPPFIFKKCSIDTTSIASKAFNDASIDLGSTEYGYRTMNSRGVRERDHHDHPREPIEPLDPHHNYHLNHNHHVHHHHHREGSVKRGQFTRSLSNTEPPTDEKTGRNSFVIQLISCCHSYTYVSDHFTP